MRNEHRGRNCAGAMVALRVPFLERHYGYGLRISSPQFHAIQRPLLQCSVFLHTSGFGHHVPRRRVSDFRAARRPLLSAHHDREESATVVRLRRAAVLGSAGWLRRQADPIVRDPDRAVLLLAPASVQQLANEHSGLCPRVSSPASPAPPRSPPRPSNTGRCWGGIAAAERRGVQHNLAACLAVFDGILLSLHRGSTCAIEAAIPGVLRSGRIL